MHCLILPLPPTDNRLHLSTAGGRRYPTRAYKDWLLAVRPLIIAWMGDTATDTTTWWRVQIYLTLGARRGDPSNYRKALLDALSGAFVDEETNTIRRGRGVWDDDCRATVHEDLWFINHPEPEVRIELKALQVGPVDWKAREKAEKAEARQREKAERAALKAAAR